MVKLTLTPKALEKLLNLRMGDVMDGKVGLFQAALRINVIGGGCSGLQYKMSWVEDLDKDDYFLECGGLMVLMNEKSAMLTFGMTIDYDDSLNGKGFEFINPNAKRSCGCGESFSI